jgi:DNA replication and repair protein RecF
LEAIYFLATFVSFHAESDRQLINFVAGREPLAVARIVAEFCRQGASAQDASHPSSSHRLEVRIIQESNGLNGGVRARKEVLLDGLERKVSEAVGAFNAVLFQPQSLRVVEGAPDERRRYLNLTLAQAIPVMQPPLPITLESLSRNALLKQLNERGGDTSQLAYWDELMLPGRKPDLRPHQIYPGIRAPGCPHSHLAWR